jgi:DNA-binding NarL/FixJ family response regulator
MPEAKTIVLVGQNLYFLGHLETLAEPQGHETLRATNEAAFWRHYNRQPPALVLVDLEGDESVWTAVVTGVRSQAHGVRMIAFGPHEDTAALEQARTLGCDAAMSKGEFNRDLPKIIGELGGGLKPQ